jgi:hypothetical protein
VRRADGQRVPQIALEHFLPRPLAAYQAASPAYCTLRICRSYPARSRYSPACSPCGA